MHFVVVILNAQFLESHICVLLTSNIFIEYFLCQCRDMEMCQIQRVFGISMFLFQWLLLIIRDFLQLIHLQLLLYSWYKLNILVCKTGIQYIYSAEINKIQNKKHADRSAWYFGLTSYYFW